jgi:hypothetical protein
VNEHTRVGLSARKEEGEIGGVSDADLSSERQITVCR